MKDKDIKNAESSLDSANQNNPSLRANPQDLRGNPPIEKSQNPQSELPRSRSLARNDDYFLDSANPQNLVKNNFVRSTQNSPASWCKKSESKGAEVPPADFLLEAEKRGSPPKSEKAAAFWRVGGAGRGVQPFLREKTSENNSKGFAESERDSSVASLPQNDNVGLDSSLRKCSAQNDKIGAENDNFREIAETNLDSANQAQNPKLHSIIVGASGLSLGISIVVAILLGVGAGILMQRIFNVTWVLFLGVLWGIAAAVLNVYKVYKAELRDFESLANEPKYKY